VFVLWVVDRAGVFDLLVLGFGGALLFCGWRWRVSCAVRFLLWVVVLLIWVLVCFFWLFGLSGVWVVWVLACLVFRVVFCVLFAVSVALGWGAWRFCCCCIFVLFVVWCFGFCGVRAFGAVLLCVVGFRCLRGCLDLDFVLWIDLLAGCVWCCLCVG